MMFMKLLVVSVKKLRGEGMNKIMEQQEQERTVSEKKYECIHARLIY